MIPGQDRMRMRGRPTGMIALMVMVGWFPTSAGAQGRFACTEVLGFSQSMEWYGGFSIAESRRGQGPAPRGPIGPRGAAGGRRGGASGPPGSGARIGGNGGGRQGVSSVVPGPQATLDRAGAFLPGWQGRFTLGATLERWLDPGYQGWSGEFVTNMSCDAVAVDRVVFNVSAFGQWLPRLETIIPQVVDMIRARYPSVRQIVLQPMVGGPAGQCLEVRDAANHGLVAAALRDAARDIVQAGPPPIVQTCSQFRDQIGHLTAVGAQYLQQQLRDHYRQTPQ